MNRWGRRAQIVCAVGAAVVVFGGTGVIMAGSVNQAWPASAARPPVLTLRLAGAVDPAWNGWIQAGDVLRFRLALSGSMRRARVALAADPASATLSAACPRKPSVSPPGQVCDLGRVRDGREMDVRVTVPPGARQVALTAVAHIKRPADTRTRWLSRTTAVIVGTRMTSLETPNGAYVTAPRPGDRPLGPPLAPRPGPSATPRGLTEDGVLPAMPPPLRPVQDS
ncbi:hypothetical protein J5X84_32450 [Streptosporangiaceae bacterium NEAU-GS5]|nr:hypothetical protein [Streptosporangiaceae bacterium NEAU-GS5]